MSVSRIIREKLVEAFSPEILDIVDESAKHHGHSGARPEGETHFYVQIVSRHFEGLSSLKRHRLIHTTLAEELRHPVHALSLATMTPREYAERH